ncbi:MULTISPECIES: hypothetical protein [unclassified Streptomyces]|uniref:hypothetical protein n=1 Tax=unclassified Streptomyces TaxID=2593676 RepID=UPI0020259F69|nr:MULTISPECIES: hypothetical protein [unclassified Streptomyces]MCX4550290.1 hypothetical protein [Streptomyces sp. NBC_01500]
MDFALPEDFTEIRIGLSPEEVREEVIRQVGAAASTRFSRSVDELTLAYMQSTWLLEQQGAFYAASCFGLIGQEVSSGTLVLTSSPLDDADPLVVAQGISKAIADHGAPDCGTKVLEIPMGPAAISVDRRQSIEIPNEYSLSGYAEEIPLLQFKAFVPVSSLNSLETASLLALTFTTPNIGHWDSYARMLADLLRTLRCSAETSEPFPV